MTLDKDTLKWEVGGRAGELVAKLQGFTDGDLSTKAYETVGNYLAAMRAFVRNEHPPEGVDSFVSSAAYRTWVDRGLGNWRNWEDDIVGVVDAFDHLREKGTPHEGYGDKLKEVLTALGAMSKEERFAYVKAHSEGKNCRGTALYMVGALPGDVYLNAETAQGIVDPMPVLETPQLHSLAVYRNSDDKIVHMGVVHNVERRGILHRWAEGKSLDQAGVDNAGSVNSELEYRDPFAIMIE